MSNLRHNIIANFAGKTWAVALGLIFPPIYLRLLGVESYGLIGIWASLNAILNILDLGLSTTLNREVARSSTESDDASRREMRDVTRTIEVIFWMAGLFAGLAIALLAPLIGQHWIHAQRLSTNLVTSSIRLMGVVFAFQWPAGAYNGGMFGLQKQVTLNVIQAVFTALRLIGGALLLWKVSASISLFFIWQAIVMGAQTLATGMALSRSFPGTGRKGTFRWRLLAKNWRFSGGMMVLSILSMVLVQADKVIVSKLLTLEQFGYYTLAWIAGGALGNLINPIFVAVFPRLSQLAKQHDTKELTRVYHASCQLLSVLVLPAVAVLALFSREVLFAWSGDRRLVEMAARVLAVMAIGSGLNGLMNVPYALMLAYGWTRLNIVANVIGVLVIVPLEYWLAVRHGAAGAAVGWLTLNAGYVLVLIPMLHRRLLPGELWRWYLHDVGLPLLALCAVILPIRLFLTAPDSRTMAFLYVAAVGVVALTAAGMSIPAFRTRGRTILAEWQPRRLS